jgi:hypothetical protein
MQKSCATLPSAGTTTLTVAGELEVQFLSVAAALALYVPAGTATV